MLLKTVRCRHSPLITRQFTMQYSSLPDITKNPLQKMKDLIATSRQMLRQYLNGAKLLRLEIKEASQIKKKIKNSSYNPTRREFVFLRRNAQDLYKLVPFFLIVLILPESLPFVVLKVPSMIPSTCWNEEQIAMRRRKLDDRRKQLSLLSHDTLKIQFKAVSPQDFTVSSYITSMDAKPKILFTHTKMINEYLGLKFKYVPEFWNRVRLIEHLEFLREDDEYLLTSLSALTPEELHTAAQARGILTTDRSNEEIEKDMKEWVELHCSRKKGDLEFSGMCVWREVVRAGLLEQDLKK